MRKLSFCLLSAVVFFSTPSRADTLAPDYQGRGHITDIGGGIKELGLSTTFVAHYSQDYGVESSNAMFVILPTFRLFLATNFPLEINFGFFYRSSNLTVAHQKGMMGGVALSYYISLGSGFFLAPRVGFSGFYGWHDVPIGNGVYQSNTEPKRFGWGSEFRSKFNKLD
jgi:hypothetical protein